MLPWLAVYRLPDVGWLHDAGCGLWEVDLEVEVEGGGERRSVFEVAEFETGFWEEVGGLEEVRGNGGWDDKGPAVGLVLVFWEGDGDVGLDVEAVLRASRPRLAGDGGGERVRSTLFRADETRPCPPSARKRRRDSVPVLKRRYLCLVRLICGRGDGSCWLTPCPAA